MTVSPASKHARVNGRCGLLYLTVTLSILILSGCSDAAETAKRRYEILKRNGTADQICEAGQQWANVYLERGEEFKYREASVAASIECGTARTDEQMSARDPMME